MATVTLRKMCPLLAATPRDTTPPKRAKRAHRCILAAVRCIFLSPADGEA